MHSSSPPPPLSLGKNNDDGNNNNNNEFSNDTGHTEEDELLRYEPVTTTNESSNNNSVNVPIITTTTNTNAGNATMNNASNQSTGSVDHSPPIPNSNNNHNPTMDENHRIETRLVQGISSIVNWNDLQRELANLLHRQQQQSFSNPSDLSHHHYHHQTNDSSNPQPFSLENGRFIFVDRMSQQQQQQSTTETTAVPIATTGLTGSTGATTSVSSNDAATGDAAARQTLGEQLGFSSNRELLEAIFKIVPLILLPSLLFLYFHLVGVLTFIWLFLAIFTVHERLKQQVSLKENRSLFMSVLLILICVAHISLLYFFLYRYKPWMFLIFQDASTEKLGFWDSLFFVVINGM
jgi:hypothetical protein